ncbi:putative BTB/POZ domain-containing protein At2g40440 [Brassica rapa]|uniref:putative BTB/POZ domain-containing protein At2g40440 n=1 Tax=Brassica campestris TaxID=3711 RepID=UPI00142E5B94|nr:putative BTB/POZ domain-containing protein At2g40440 [Brassica rapa]
MYAAVTRNTAYKVLDSRWVVRWFRLLKDVVSDFNDVVIVFVVFRDQRVSNAFFLDGFAHILEEQWQVDVLLKAGDSDPDAAISAHKLVLAARSKVFKKMLEEDECKTSSGKEIITLSEMKHEEVKALVEFIYNSGLTPCAEHARSLYLAADKYEIPHLRNLCRTNLYLL